MADSRTRRMTIGGGLGLVALVAVLFVVYSGGSESSVPPPRTDASLDGARDEFSEDDQVTPVRDRGAGNGDEDRSRLAGDTDEVSVNTTAGERDPQAKKNAKRRRKKRGKNTSGREKEEEEEEQSKDQRRWPKPSLTPPGKP